MNADLPVLGDLPLLLWHGLATSLSAVLTTWWGVTITIVMLTVWGAAAAAPHGTDEMSPILTEADREKARS